MTVIAEPVQGRDDRMRFFWHNLESNRSGYVIAAFRNGKLNASPRINDQQLSLTCIQK